MSTVYALVSAFLNALNVVSQHTASTSAPPRIKAWRLAVYLVSQPLWLFGLVAMAGAFVFQALALYHGRLSVVQPVLVTELVFALVLRRLWLHRSVTGQAWASASATCVGLGVFLVMAEPHGGHQMPTGGAWVSVISTLTAVTAVCVVLAGRGTPVRRGAFYATGAGIVLAMMATFIKSTADDFGAGGLAGMFGHGSIYGLVVAGLVGSVLTQAALHHGPLAVSQSLMVIVDPCVSVLLGVWLFGEHFQGAPIRFVLALVSFVVMAAGVVFITRTAPSTSPPLVPPKPPPTQGS